MKVELKGNTLYIEIEANVSNPRPSATGKTLIVSTTSGNVNTGVMINGKPLTLGLNAYLKA